MALLLTSAPTNTYHHPHDDNDDKNDDDCFNYEYPKIFIIHFVGSFQESFESMRLGATNGRDFQFDSIYARSTHFDQLFPTTDTAPTDASPRTVSLQRESIKNEIMLLVQAILASRIGIKQSKPLGNSNEIYVYTCTHTL